MSRPIVFLAFANNPSAPLESLEREEALLKQYLQPLENEGFISLITESFATLDIIFDRLTESQGKVVLFHYAGHAGSDAMLLRDGEAKSDGLATVLAQQEELGLVFLNGCTTGPQVKRLQELKVPNVIGTSQKIPDEAAMEFADKLYHALVHKQPLSQAFETAAAFLQSKDMAGGSGHRGFLTEEDLQVEVPLWNLYSLEEESSGWKMPDKSTVQIVVKGPGAGPGGSKAAINETLTNTLWEALAPFSDELEFYQMKAQKGDPPDIRMVRMVIMNALPLPLAEQVRKLFAADTSADDDKMDQIGMDRLRQLVRTYVIMVDLLLFALMARLWDARHENPDIVVNENTKKLLEAYLTRSAQEVLVFDPVPLAKAIRIDFEEDGIPFFIEEHERLKGYMEDEKAFVEAVAFMNQIKRELYDDNEEVSADELEPYCLEAEAQLSTLLKYLSFLANYKLQSVKDIRFVKFRNQDPRYSISRVKLDKVTAGVVDLDDEFESFSEHCSVILMKQHDTFGERLNLSPFILDENAWTRNPRTKLFHFERYDPASGAIHYGFTESEDKLVVKDQDWAPYVLDQMAEFFKVVLGKNPGRT